jgi:hypothetical protein
VTEHYVLTFTFYVYVGFFPTQHTIQKRELHRERGSDGALRCDLLPQRIEVDPLELGRRGDQKNVSQSILFFFFFFFFFVFLLLCFYQVLYFFFFSFRRCSFTTCMRFLIYMHTTSLAHSRTLHTNHAAAAEEKKVTALD